MPFKILFQLKSFRFSVINIASSAFALAAVTLVKYCSGFSMGEVTSELNHKKLRKLSSSIGSFREASVTITEYGFSIVSDKNSSLFKLLAVALSFVAEKA